MRKYSFCAAPLYICIAAAHTQHYDNLRSTHTNTETGQERYGGITHEVNVTESKNKTSKNKTSYDIGETTHTHRDLYRVCQLFCLGRTTARTMMMTIIMITMGIVTLRHMQTLSLRFFDVRTTAWRGRDRMI